MSLEDPLIAVVDDEESIRRALTRLLRSAGLAVESFPSGIEFFESLEERCPDCLVLDLHMPRMDGFAVQTRLAETGARIPVIVITAHDSPEAQGRAVAGRPVAWFRKPVDGQALLDAIACALRQGVQRRSKAPPPEPAPLNHHPCPSDQIP